MPYPGEGRRQVSHSGTKETTRHTRVVVVVDGLIEEDEVAAAVDNVAEAAAADDADVRRTTMRTGPLPCSTNMTTIPATKPSRPTTATFCPRALQRQQI